MPLAVGSFGPLESAGPAVIWLVVLTFVFLECALIVGLFLPGDSMLITAGVVLASYANGASHTWALSVGAMIAAIAGNQVGYVIGQRSGHKLVARRDGKYLNVHNLKRVHVLLERHGFWAVLLARWIPWIRTLCPLVAGSAGMNHRNYTVASSLGAVVWAPVLLLLGFYAGTHLDRVSWLMPTVMVVLCVILVVGTVLGVRHYNEEMAKQPVEVTADETTD